MNCCPLWMRSQAWPCSLTILLLVLHQNFLLWFHGGGISDTIISCTILCERDIYTESWNYFSETKFEAVGKSFSWQLSYCVLAMLSNGYNWPTHVLVAVNITKFVYLEIDNCTGPLRKIFTRNFACHRSLLKRHCVHYSNCSKVIF